MDFKLTITSNDRASKKVQVLKKLQKHLTAQEITQVEDNFYGNYDFVTCFIAEHYSENEDDCCGFYTWYLPSELVGKVSIFEGDIVEVENLDDTAIVRVVRGLFEITREQHVEDIHPYCAFIRKAEPEEFYGRNLEGLTDDE